MEIKGITGPPLVEVQSPSQSPSVRPTAPSNPASPVTPQQVSANTLQLSPPLLHSGQLMEVVVAKVDSKMLTLMLQNPFLDANNQRVQLQLKAPASFPAQVGQQLTVQVKNIVNGLPQLQVVATNTEALNPSNALHVAQQQQGPTPPLYANLSQLQQLQHKQQLDALPAQVRERVQALWRALPDNTQIQKTPGLKQAMNYSGPFLESALLAMARHEGQYYPAKDVQAGLLRLASAIRTQLETAARSEHAQTHTQTGSASQVRTDAQASITPPSTGSQQAANPAQVSSDKPLPPSQNANAAQPVHPEIPQAQARATATVTTLTTEHLLQQLLQQTEGGLARMLTQQLHTVNHDPQRPLWLLELPVRHDNGVDVFDLRIQRDTEQGQASERAQHTWTVMLAFDLPELGPIRAQVSLVNDQISTYWWADQDNTVSLFHQHLDQLQHRFSSAGLKVNKLHCQQGIPDAAQQPRNAPISNVMLDEKI